MLTNQVKFVVAASSLKRAKSVFAVDFVRYIATVDQGGIPYVERLFSFRFFFIAAAIVRYSPVFDLLEQQLRELCVFVA